MSEGRVSQPATARITCAPRELLRATSLAADEAKRKPPSPVVLLVSAGLLQLRVDRPTHSVLIPLDGAAVDGEGAVHVFIQKLRDLARLEATLTPDLELHITICANKVVVVAGNDFCSCTYQFFPARDSKLEKRKRVEALLRDPANRLSSNHQIARAARVTAASVGQTKRRLSINEAMERRRVCRNGKTFLMSTDRIGKRRPYHHL